MIEVTKHAVRKYKSRIANNEGISNKLAKKIILEILKDARYVSDNSNGVLLRNNDLRIEMILKNRRVITIYPIELKGKGNGVQ